MATATHICLDCKSSIRPITITPGSFFIELLLWIAFLVPGLIYSIWRISSKYQACRICKSKRLVPIGSTAANNILQQKKEDKQKVDIPDQIKKLAELKESGVLTEQEFNEKKSKLLAQM